MGAKNRRNVTQEQDVRMVTQGYFIVHNLIAKFLTVDKSGNNYLTSVFTKISPKVGQPDLDIPPDRMLYEVKHYL